MSTNNSKISKFSVLNAKLRKTVERINNSSAVKFLRKTVERINNSSAVKFLVKYVKKAALTEKGVLISVILLEAIFLAYCLYARRAAPLCPNYPEPIFIIHGIEVTRAEMVSFSFFASAIILLGSKLLEPELTRKKCLEYFVEVSNKPGSK